MRRLLITVLPALLHLACRDTDLSIPPSYRLVSIELGSTENQPIYNKRMAQTSDGGVVVVFNVRNPSKPDETVEDISVRKYDATGQLVWSYRQQDAYQSYGQSVFTCSNGDIVVAGAKGLGIYYTSQAEPYLIRLSSAGELIWKKSYDHKWRDQAILVVETAAKNIVALVSTSGTADGAPYLLKTDADGNELWRKDFDYHCTGTSDIFPTGADGFVLAGPVITEYDGDGNELWCYSPGEDATLEPSGYWWYCCATPLDNGTIAAFGTVEFGGVPNNCNAPSQVDFVLGAVNSSGSANAPLRYHYQYQNIARGLSRTSDGGFLLLGDAVDIPTCNGFTIPDKINLLKLSSIGKEEWHYVLSLGFGLSVLELSPDTYAFMTDRVVLNSTGGQYLSLNIFARLEVP